MTFEPRTGRLCDSSLPQIGVNAYAPRPGDSGKDKLDDSAIHPAVVATRGYTMIRDPQQARAAILATGYTIGSNRWSGLAKAREAAATGDALVMPWFTPGDRDVPAAVQFRPMTPLAGADGREQKYAWPARQDVVMDVHPAIPHHWLGDTSVRLIVTEGLLKGDAIVSAMMRASGADLDEAATREQVAQVLEGLDEGMRCVPVAIGGVTQWRNVPGWESLHRSGRDVYIAFDADVRTNPMVWRQARAMFEMVQAAHGTPRLIDLGLAGCDGKDGVDDYLARGGTIVDLTQDAVTGELPPAPAGADRKVGEAYMSEDETRCFVLKVGRGGEMIEEELIGVGGHVQAFEYPHLPSPAEIEAGVITVGTLPAGVDDCVVRIALSHRDGEGMVRHSTIRASRRILSEDSAQWASRRGYQIEGSVDQMPKWPPTRAWSDALKTRTMEEYGEPVAEIRSACYGWLPGTDGKPVFAMGRQVIGDNPTVKIAEREHATIPAAAKFGLMDPGANWREVGAQTLPVIVHALLSSGVWADRGIGVFTLAGGLRPVIPIRPKTTLYLYGPPQSGKTWTATKMMKFWAAGREHFHSRDSGGSPADTEAAIENVIGRVPIWLADDLAPSPSSNRYNAQRAAVESMIRNIANGQGKARMRSDLTSRQSITPRALGLVTAENANDNASVANRTISLRFRARKSLVSGPKEALDDLFDGTDTPMRATGALLRWAVDYASAGPEGWAGFVADCYRWQEQVDAQVCARLQALGVSVGQVTRLREMAKDVLATVFMLRQACADMGLEGDERLADLFADGVLDSAIDLVMVAKDDQDEGVLARRFMEAVVSLLESGNGYVTSADGGQPDTREDGSAVSLALGWTRASSGVLEARGTRIGRFLPDKEGHDGVVVFTKLDTFHAVRRHYPEVLKAGATCKDTWAYVAGDGYLEPVGSLSKGSWVIRTGPRKQVRGMPVRLSSLLGMNLNEAPSQD